MDLEAFVLDGCGGVSHLRPVNLGKGGPAPAGQGSAVAVPGSGRIAGRRSLAGGADLGTELAEVQLVG